MSTFGNCTIAFLVSSTYQTAYIVNVVRISAGSSKTSSRFFVISTAFPSSSTCENLAPHCATSWFCCISSMSLSNRLPQPRLSTIRSKARVPAQSSSVSVSSSTGACRAAVILAAFAADRNVNRLGDSASSEANVCLRLSSSVKLLLSSALVSSASSPGGSSFVCLRGGYLPNASN